MTREAKRDLFASGMFAGLTVAALAQKDWWNVPVALSLSVLFFLWVERPPRRFDGNRTVVLIIALISLFLVGLRLLGADTTAPAAVVAPPDPGTTRAHIDWSDYPKNKLSTNLTFRVIWSATLNAALTNWLVVATIVGTNTQADVVIPSVDGNSFFAVSGSNLFGQVFLSNIATLSPPVDAFVPVKVSGVVRGK